MTKPKKPKAKAPPRGKEPVRPLQAVPPVPPPTGRRVAVKSGDGGTDLGEGTYVGDVEVYFIQMPSGTLRSEKNAERPPLPTSVPPGAKVVKSTKNPKIVLDSGRVVYGCQVWWEYLVPESVKTRVREGFASLMAGTTPTDSTVREVLMSMLTNEKVVRAVEEGVMAADAFDARQAEEGRTGAV